MECLTEIRAFAAGPAAAVLTRGLTRGLVPAIVLSASSLAAATGPPAPRPAPPAVEGFLYTRPVEVPARGWVQVPLDLTTLRHLVPGGSAEAVDLRVFGPAGGELASRVVPAMAEEERRDATVLELRPEAAGWAITFDLGPSPPPHERLIFDFARLARAPEVSLEASSDRQSWEPVAAGDLFQFQIGTGGGLQRTSLVYPPSDRRYLRLHWPQEGGFPEVRRVEVETAPRSSLAVTARAAECERLPPAATVCRLPLPAAGQILRQLTLNLVGQGSVGYRLYEPHDARWRPLAEGVFQTVRPGARLSLPFEPRPIAGDLLRLELYGPSPSAAAAPGSASIPASNPILKSFGAELAIETVVFDAPAAGIYTLAYGGGAGEARTAAALPRGAADEIAWLAPGPEQEHPPPPLPPAATAPGNPIGDTRFEAVWKVAAPGVPAGALVRLELPASLYAYARPDLGDVRLSARGRQVPYLRWTPPAPSPVLEQAGLRAWPMSRQKGGVSRVDLELPRSGQPLSQLLLTAPAAPLKRALAVRYIEPPRPGVEGTETVAARTTWECLPHPPLPCRTLLALSAPAPAHLDLRFEDRDNPPLADLAIEIVRRGDVLVFALPKGEVTLLAGARRLTAPDYDIQALRDRLLASPWRTAEIELAVGVAAPASHWTRWLVPATLLLATALLFLLLRRVLSGA